MTRSRVLLWQDPAFGVQMSHLEGGIAGLPLIFKTQVSVNNERSHVSVVLHPVAAHPRVDEGKRQDKHQDQGPPVPMGRESGFHASVQWQPQSKRLYRTVHQIHLMTSFHPIILPSA